MPRTTITLMLLFVLACFCHNSAVSAQDGVTSLKQGEPIERRIARGETHTYSVRLEQDQFLQVVVDQRGMDVTLQASTPDGKQVGNVSSPNGANGVAGVTLVAHVPGLYQITVTPPGQAENTTSGRYEIRILDLRQATKEEINAAGGQDAIKAKGMALLNETAEAVQQIRSPEIRIRAQVQAAQLLWATDEKRARKLVAGATADINEYLASISIDDPDYSQSYQMTQQLRIEVVQALSVNDPELALSFLRSTHVLTDPNEQVGYDSDATERQLEVSLASRIAEKNPKRSYEIAEESLRKGYAYNFVDTLNQLQSTDPDSAAKLAGDIATKLEGESLLKSQAATVLLSNLLQSARPSQSDDEGKLKPSLLSEGQYRDLLNKALSAALAYTPPPGNVYSVEKNTAQILLSSLQALKDETSKYAPSKAAAVEKASAAFNTPPDPTSQMIQQYQETINNAPVSQALEVVAQVPEEYKPQFYQQVASKAASNGDFGMARQILNEHVKNAFQRQMAANNIDQQAIYSAISAGKLPEALEIVNRLRVPAEQAMMLVNAVNQMGTTQRRETLMGLLEQARGLVGGPGRIENLQQMNAVFEIAKAYLRLEPKRSFEAIEPVVDQFNEMSAAAAAMSGFDQQYLRNGELMMQNGNSLTIIVNELGNILGLLAASDFDRTKGLADKIQRPEVRLNIYLVIARQATGESQGATPSSPRLVAGPRVSIGRFQ